MPTTSSPAPSLPGFEVLSSTPTAGLVIVHGLAEYAGRYRDTAGQLASRGISCFAYDQRGHGDAPGVRTHVARFAHFVDDLAIFAAHIRERFPELPLFVWGHSMGSIAATLAAARPDSPYVGIITSSHSLDVFRRGRNPLSPFTRLAALIAPRVRIPLRLDSTRISSDESVQLSYAADPRIPKDASLRLIVEFAAACAQCRDIAPTLRTPWLVVHGEADRIAPVSGSRTLFELLGSPDKQLVTYPEARHEVQNEKAEQRERLVELIAQWILARVPGTTRAVGAAAR